jgi:hypothetical protein
MRLVFLLLLLVSFESKSQILYGGNHIIEPYLGIPNMARLTDGASFFNINGASSGKVTKFRGLAPSGLRYSYMISEDVSFGFDLIYNYSNVTSTTTDTLYNGITGQWEYQSATAQDITRRLRFQARVNFHIQTSQPESDSYFGLGIGTNNRWITKYNNGIFQDKLKGSETSLLPFSMRICYGYRHYFGYNWGIMGEVGIGGPLLSFGVSYKM